MKRPPELPVTEALINVDESPASLISIDFVTLHLTSELQHFVNSERKPNELVENQ